MTFSPGCAWIVIGCAEALPPMSAIVTGFLTKSPGCAGTGGSFAEGRITVTGPATLTCTIEELGSIVTVAGAVVINRFCKGYHTPPNVGPSSANTHCRDVPP